MHGNLEEEGCLIKQKDSALARYPLATETYASPYFVCKQDNVAKNSS